MLKESVNESIEKVARRNMANWLESLKTKNPELVASFYAEENTFLPTVCGRFRKGKTEAKNYFEHFLAKNPQGEVVEEEIRPISSDVYLHAGLYNFTVNQNDKTETVPARFTYIWKKGEDGIWRIIHHHSSIKPATH